MLQRNLAIIARNMETVFYPMHKMALRVGKPLGSVSPTVRDPTDPSMLDAKAGRLDRARPGRLGNGPLKGSKKNSELA